MKRSVALAASLGLFLGGCTYESRIEGVRESAGSRRTAAEILQADVNRDIVPHLGNAGLTLLLGVRDEATNSIDLVVTHDSYCASTFGIAKDELDGTNTAIIRLDLFGNFNDLIDTRRLDDSDMFNGAIGHGDNIVTSQATYVPGDPASINAVLNYMKQGTNAACSPQG